MARNCRSLRSTSTNGSHSDTAPGNTTRCFSYKKITFKPSQDFSCDISKSEFVQRTSMPDMVKCLTDLTEDSPDFFPESKAFQLA